MAVSHVVDAALVPHHGVPSPADVRGISASITHAADGALWLVFRVRAAEGALRWPGVEAGRADSAPRRDGLWQHTCCELFIRRDDGGATYREFNFSPCGAWAAYDFVDYRVQAPLPAVAVPRIRSHADEAGYVVEVHLPAGCLPPCGAAGGWRFGLAAVLEAGDGGLSWWALCHPAARPDFHHREGFALRVNDLFDPSREAS